jgi:hypothetical protein
MQGPASVAREGLADGVAAGGVEPLQAEHEPPLQDTHLAGGDLDAVFGPQYLADLFALAVVIERCSPAKTITS